MRAAGTGRARLGEPFPWFVLALIALAAVALVATSAARIYRFHLLDSAREQQWRVEHEALMRELGQSEAAPQPRDE